MEKDFTWEPTELSRFTLICNYPDAKIYTLNVNLEALKILDIDAALKIGKQYVALTEKACKKINIIDEQKLIEKERDKLKQESETNRSKSITMAEEICRKYRCDGQFFDEILKASEKNGKSHS